MFEVHVGGPLAFYLDKCGRIGVGIDRQVVGGERNFKVVTSMDMRRAIGVGITEDSGEAVFATRDIDGLEEVG